MFSQHTDLSDRLRLFAVVTSAEQLVRMLSRGSASKGFAYIHRIAWLLLPAPHASLCSSH